MEDHMTASSTAHDAKRNQKQPRKRADNPAYSMPGLKTPRFTICDQSGPHLEPALNPLARALSAFDLALLRRVQTFHQKHMSSSDEARKAEAVRWKGEFFGIKQQWKDIDLSQRQFSQSYLQGNQFIPIWVEGLRIIKDALRSNVSGNQFQKQNHYIGILTKYESLACNLRDQMVDTARQGLLEREALYSIQERWVRLDETLDWYYGLCNSHLDEDTPPMDRSAPKWQEVRCSVQINDPRTKNDNDPLQTQPNKTAGLLESKSDSTFILWSTLFGCAVTSTVLFALGYAHSPHLQGTTNDADFWFLIQATITQLLGLVVSALLEWKSDRLPQWRWVLPTAIAGVCSITAIPLYLVAPTEWSSFLSLTAGATQSFMVLQYFLS